MLELRQYGETAETISDGSGNISSVVVLLVRRTPYSCTHDAQARGWSRVTNDASEAQRRAGAQACAEQVMGNTFDEPPPADLEAA